MEEEDDETILSTEWTNGTEREGVIKWEDN